MDNRILITGVNSVSIFDQNVISQLEDIFDIMIVKPTENDIKENIEEHEPIAAILCVAEDGDISLQIYNIIKNNSDIPIIIIGTMSARNAAEETIGKENIIYEITPPFGASEIKVALEEYFENQENDDFVFEDNINKNEADQASDNCGFSAGYYNNELEGMTKYMHNGDLRKKILIIDDDVKILRLMNLYLCDKYDVTIMKDGRSAMRYLRTNMPDLILLDYIMPLEDGPEVYRKIKLVDRLRSIPIFFLTGVSDRKKVKKVLELKPEGYILKPIQRDQLVERIDSFFGTYIY